LCKEFRNLNSSHRCHHVSITCRCQWECANKQGCGPSEQFPCLELRRGTWLLLRFNAGWPHTTTWQG